MSVVVRLPEELYASARHFAALEGRQASELLAEAWDQYVRDHRDRLAERLEEQARLLRAGDTHGVAELVVGEAEAADKRG